MRRLAALCAVAFFSAGFAAGPSTVTGPHAPAEAERPPAVLAEFKKRALKPKPAEPSPRAQTEPAPGTITAAPPAAGAAQPGENPTAAQGPERHERIETDISTHQVAVTSVFKGTEIVVFGTVLDSRQESAESGYYDVVVVIEGRPAPAIVREKRPVGGMWVNARGVRFDGLPIYLAIAATRPLSEVAEPLTLAANGVGFLRARMVPGRGVGGLEPGRIDAFKAAFQRLKEKDGLYVHADYGVGFVGRSLFRASIRLPANVPVGPLAARTYLFHDGELLSAQTTRVVLRRSGLERIVYDMAFEYPAAYGALSVVFAAAVSLLASWLMQRFAR